MRGRFDGLDKNLNSGQIEKVKIKELRDEVKNYILYLPMILQGHYP